MRNVIALFLQVNSIKYGGFQVGYIVWGEIHIINVSFVFFIIIVVVGIVICFLAGLSNKISVTPLLVVFNLPHKRTLTVFLSSVSLLLCLLAM